MYSGLTYRPEYVNAHETSYHRPTDLDPIISPPIQNVLGFRRLHHEPLTSVCHHLVHPLPHVFGRVASVLRGKLDTTRDLLDVLAHISFAERDTAV